jgi:hypothetical protein
MHIHTQTPNIHALSGIRTHDPGFRASKDSVCLRPFGYRDRQCDWYRSQINKNCDIEVLVEVIMAIDFFWDWPPVVSIFMVILETEAVRSSETSVNIHQMLGITSQTTVIVIARNIDLLKKSRFLPDFISIGCNISPVLLILILPIHEIQNNGKGRYRHRPLAPQTWRHLVPTSCIWRWNSITYGAVRVFEHLR